MNEHKCSREWLLLWHEWDRITKELRESGYDLSKIKIVMEGGKNESVSAGSNEN